MAIIPRTGRAGATAVGLGYRNVLFVDIDGKTIYEDHRQTEDDFSRAMKRAMDEAPRGSYKIGIALDTTRDSKVNLLVTMDSHHDVGRFPLTIEVMEDERPDSLLDRIRTSIEQHFDTETIEFDLEE